jgi:hypothetical protein
MPRKKQPSVPTQAEIDRLEMRDEEEWRAEQAAMRERAAEARRAAVLAAYERYDADPRVSGPDDRDAFVEAVTAIWEAGR